MTLPALELGPVVIAPVPLMVGIAVLLGHFLFIGRARRDGLDPQTAAWASFLLVLGGFLGGHLFRFAYDPGILSANPSILFQVFRGQASFGGLAGGLLTAWMFLHFRARGRVLRYLDALAAVFPVPWLIGRLSCVVAHDHPGLRSTHPLAVRYPDGPRFDLGLIESLWIALFLIPFMYWLSRCPRRPGLLIASYLLVYVMFRLWLDTLHVDPPRWLGVTIDQWAAGTGFLAGSVLLGVVCSSPSAGKPGSPPIRS